MLNTPIITYVGRYEDAASMAAPASVLSAQGWLSHRAGLEADEEITPAEALSRRSAVLAAIVAKIPAGITRVLDIGCGNGDFAAALHATRPEVNYRGIDISMEAIAAANTNLETSPGNLPANVELQTANLTEYLLAGVDDWDFIVSSRCVFRETRRSGDRALLRLIDSKAPKGWFIYGTHWRMLRPDLQYVMQEALTNSTDPTEHYFKGAQSFLNVDAAFVGYEKEHPAYIIRGASVAPALDPGKYQKFDVMKNGKFEEARAQGTLKYDSGMTEYKSATFDAQGQFTGEVVVAKAGAPAKAELATLESQKTNLQNLKQIAG
ncbi:MAG: hypothetical protein CMJ67_10630 [Planctomycetaceae bacterium]|nr:hypothetical protein [Planctomycetaceae bacterium]